MGATYKTIAATKLTVGMTVRRDLGDNVHEYEVVGIIRDTHNRKTMITAQCKPLGDAPKLGPALYTAKNKPVIKTA